MVFCARRHVPSGRTGVEVKPSHGAKLWGFPKVRGTFLGAPIIRRIVY